MKNILTTLLFALFFTSFVQAQEVFDYTYEGQTLKYQITSEKEAKVAREGRINVIDIVKIPEEVVFRNKKYKVTNIGDAVFWECKNLSSIIIPNSVTSIGRSAFWGCESLDNVEIPKSVTSIGGSAFSECKSLTNIVIPNSVTSIGDNAFGSCGKLKKIVLPNSVTRIDDHAFSYCRDLTNIVIPNSVTSIGRGAFVSCKSLNDIVIPNSVTTIGKAAFGNAGLTKVEIPSSVTSIDDAAFNSCEALEKIEVASDNKFYSSIDEVLFNKAKDTLVSFPGSRDSYVIPSTVTHIGNSAFAICEKLKGVEIPSSVTSIGREAFAGCFNLESVTIKAETPPSMDERVFLNCSIEKIHVPAGSVKKYKNADGWSEYKDVIKAIGK